MPRPSLLKVGSCLYGHVISSEDDLKVRSSGGRTFRQCLICYKNQRKKYQRKSRIRRGLPDIPTGQFRRHIVLSCGHQPIFDSNPGGLPYPNDIILCRRCDDYRTVVRYGDPAPKGKR